MLTILTTAAFAAQIPLQSSTHVKRNPSVPLYKKELTLDMMEASFQIDRLNEISPFGKTSVPISNYLNAQYVSLFGLRLSLV